MTKHFTKTTRGVATVLAAACLLLLSSQAAQAADPLAGVWQPIDNPCPLGQDVGPSGTCQIVYCPPEARYHDGPGICTYGERLQPYKYLFLEKHPGHFVGVVIVGRRDCQADANNFFYLIGVTANNVTGASPTYHGTDGFFTPGSCQFVANGLAEMDVISLSTDLNRAVIRNCVRPPGQGEPTVDPATDRGTNGTNCELLRKTAPVPPRALPQHVISGKIPATTCGRTPIVVRLVDQPDNPVISALVLRDAHKVASIAGAAVPLPVDLRPLLGHPRRPGKHVALTVVVRMARGETVRRTYRLSACMPVRHP
jgi:hypothetical protein